MSMEDYNFAKAREAWATPVKIVQYNCTCGKTMKFESEHGVIAPQRTEQNFCARCGKRTNDIHTCTPPQRSESSGKPSAWVGLTNEELTDLFYNTNLGQQSAVSQAVALLKQKNT